MNVTPVKGKVFVKLPTGGKFARASQKGAGFVRLTTARTIPVRSILDTTQGTVSLRTARNRRGRLQSGRFTAGVFRVLQARSGKQKGLTTLRLKGSAAKFRRCGLARRAASPRRPHACRAARSGASEAAHAAATAPAAGTPPRPSAAPSGPSPTAATAR